MQRKRKAQSGRWGWEGRGRTASPANLMICVVGGGTTEGARRTRGWRLGRG